MNIRDVKKLEPLERLLYWITERHRIYYKKVSGFRKPWTDDEVLQSYWFTNPYRENDKVTVWFRENLREPLQHSPDVLFATAAFRWFNLPETARVLMDQPTRGGYKYGLFQEWHANRASRLLSDRWQAGHQIFTGAYIIKTPPGPKGSKITNICKFLELIWEGRRNLLVTCRESRSLEAVHAALREFPYVGGFTAYEIVSDLRHTDLLRDATDINTWAYPGPGALRGLNRLAGRKLKHLGRADVLNEMRALLVVCNKRLPMNMKRFEMREVEHSLCEWSKYENALWKDGMRMKRRYNGS